MSGAETTKKVCLVGDFAVGKSSLVARFVHEAFSDRYLSTVGVSIKTKRVPVPDGGAMKLVIWDIAGIDALTTAAQRYLRGADGYMLVVDGTRPATLDSALRLRKDVARLCGPLPHVCLLNKHDLTDAWAVEEAATVPLAQDAAGLWATSAKTGDNVERAFLDLAATLSA